MKLRFLLAALSAMLCGAAAASDPYPFEGYFALETPGKTLEGCGFDILHQSRDGAFSGYLLDKRHWDAHRQARFVRYKSGTCTFDAASAIDNCVTHTHHIADVADAKPDRAKVTVLGHDAVAMLTLGESDSAERLPDLPAFVFRRCPFGAEQIAPRMVDSVGDYSKADLAEMARTRNAALAAQVLQSISETPAAVD